MTSVSLLRMGSVSAACFLVAACGGGADGTYDVSMADAKARLGSSVQQYNESGDGETMRTVRGAGWQGDRLRVVINSGHSDPITYSCAAVAQSMGETSTMITPDCSESVMGGGKAVYRELAEIEVREFVHATMTGGEMDVRKMRAAGGALATKHMPQMQGEAMAANMEEMERTYQDEQGGWTTSEDQLEDDGWGTN